MHYPTALTRQKSDDSFGPRKTTPWIASPLANKPTREHREINRTKSNTVGRVTEFDESKHDLPHSGTEEPLFREHHESSTVELFFDLFFVANLATFTSNHEIVDTASLKNYIGFFTLLWFTWLQYSLFDVRFSTDSVFNRVCKAVSFGVMTGFAVCGAIYDTTNVNENINAFRAMALILMVSRLALVGQYGVVLFYVRTYKKTTWPLALTMLALFIGAMVYLGTFFGFPDSASEESFPIEHGGPKTYAAWYALACVEALAVITVSCYWRVVSFRHTHLVERIGLLTLIIMGEGIIGMTKSVSTILQNSSRVSSSDIGSIVAAVLLIYFIWVLYFDQIEHDRFGTIRQQIWAILHFPLHVAILLTVEGSSTLIVWNIIKDLSTYLFYNLPSPGGNTEDPTFGFETGTALVKYINDTIITFNENFKNSNIGATYDYNTDLVALKNISAPYNSTAWIDEATIIENKIFFGVYDFLYAQFNVEAPESSTDSSTGGDSVAETLAKINEGAALFNVFNTVFYYFFISAGAFLLILAVMYWFGKSHKSPGEYVSMGVRLVAGCAVMVGLIAGTNLPIAGDFDYSSWIIPVVTLSYFVVITLDSLLVWHSNKTIARQTSTNRHEVFSRVDGSTKQMRNDSEISSADNSV